MITTIANHFQHVLKVESPAVCQIMSIYRALSHR